MKIIVLGGCGIQGFTAVYDLTRCSEVDAIVCADADLQCTERLGKITDISKIEFATIDASDPAALKNLFSDADAVIDLLPRQFMPAVCQAAIDRGVGVVNTNYGPPIRALHASAQAADTIIMPECGLDPGIDLIIYGEVQRQFDEINLINSYCGGLPEKAACTNPLNYKISWNWEGVLSSTKRDAVLIRNGHKHLIEGARQHENDFIHTIDFPGLGQLEAIPNGDAVFFTDLLDITDSVIETGRYSLRWPGWSAFWRPLKRFGFLDETPIPGLPAEITPYQIMNKWLAPQLQYASHEKDLVVMINIFEGVKNGCKTRLLTRLLIERDLDTGLMAMSKGVAYPASIVARMIARGDIKDNGVLSPMLHIPYELFMKELMDRGVLVEFEEIQLE